jgi:hypothetical protein
VPVSASDTCPLDLHYPSPDNQPFGARRALNLTPSLDALGAADRQALVQTIASTLAVQTPPVVVQPGERYVDALHQVVIAQEAIDASFSQALATSSSSSGCPVLCMPVPDTKTVPQPAADLILDAHITQSFTYSTSAGQPLVTDADISANAAVPNDETVQLTVTWNGTWQASVSSSQPSPVTCIAGERALAPYLSDPNGGGQLLAVAAAIAAANPADGCLFRLAGDAAYVGPPTASEYIHLLYRFGVILVVGDAGTASFSKDAPFLADLPTANAAETALALQIDATQPYS